MVRKYRVGLLVMLCAASCGSSDDKGSGEGEKACQDLAAKYSECHLVAQGVCNTAEPCAVECGAKAPCAELQSGQPGTEFAKCLAICSGAKPDDFVCADGKRYVAKAGVCDGVSQCLDGSDEASCGTPDGAGGVGGGSGVGSGGMLAASGGATGSSGGTSAGTATAACQAMVDHELAACPSISKDAELSQCADDTAQYTPEGCGAPWSAYLDCVAKAPFDCNQGPSGCDTAHAAVISCQAEFAGRTMCSRLTRDEQCTNASAPYEFGCLGAVPAGCTSLPSGSDASIVCCAAFARP